MNFVPTVINFTTWAHILSTNMSEKKNIKRNATRKGVNMQPFMMSVGHGRRRNFGRILTQGNEFYNLMLQKLGIY